MSGSTSVWVRRVVTAAAFCSVLIGVSSQALAYRPWWWSFTPVPRETPEIDAGLVSSAAAIVIGGLLVLRGRRRSS